MTPRPARAATALVAAVALAACGGGGDDTSGAAASDGAAPQGERLAVVASFYPLAYAVERVGGDRVQVANLTEAGTDPHHLELSPRQVGSVKDAALVVYEKGMQPAADAAIESASPARALDVSSLATLPADTTVTIGGDAQANDEHGADEHDEHGHTVGDGHDHGDADPHFWLDPTLYAKAVTMIADELSALDSAGAETYKANANELTAELERVNDSYEKGLATCEQRDLVTGHTSFAYLANKYKLNQVGIAGVLNDAEPDPARIAKIADFVKQHGATTLYAEQGEASEVVNTVAREAGANVVELDNLSVTKEGGYAARMDENLQVLRSGQGCS